ncbi:MAG: hypothetical protein L0211_18015, partial [Planctomycetaceae bacterium]|nr:hypothetical protein [Planctomycetaceae bacterium]
AKARLNVKLLKSKTVEPATDAQGQPLPGWVRFKIELQDYVRDRFGIVVMQDRLLTAAPQAVAIPRVETGRTDQRLVAIENAGRDEIDTAGGVSGLERLSPQQQTYRELQGVLGGTITEAYIVANENAAGAGPSLQFKTKERAAAETAAARIDLATTVLVVDAAGAYRGLQEYRVTNATEQFLEIQLPDGARLWTATVAGQPVKPVVPPQAGAANPAPAAAGATAPVGVVRIPLVKMGEGEADYPVQLKYGGQMSKVTSFAQVRFPLMKTVNINVELSQVRLHLPENFDWSSYFEFGGTMRPVVDESELSEVYQSYLNKRIQEAKELLTSVNPYTKIRAQSNLKQLAVMFDDSRSMALGDNGRQLQRGNDLLLREAEQQVQQQSGQQAAVTDNRERLNSYWMDQGVTRSKNVVSGLGSNFQQDGLAANGKESTFNPAWLNQNSLETKGEGAAEGKDANKPGVGQASGKPGGRYSRGYGKNFADDKSNAAGYGGDQAQGQAEAAQNPQLANEQQRQQLEQKLQMDADEVRDLQSGREEELGKLSRYGMKLDQETQQQELGGLAIQLPRQPPADQPMAGGPQSRSGAMGGMGGMGGGFFGGGQGAPGSADARYAAPGSQPAGGQAADPFGAPTTGGSVAASPAPAAPAVVSGDNFDTLAAGLASLDFRLPERGRAYSFTTPRGQIEISARPVANTLVGRLLGLTILAAVVLIAWAATRQPAREAYARLLGTVACGVLLALVGVISLVTGIFPYAGLVLIVIGIALAIRNRAAPTAVAAS